MIQAIEVHGHGVKRVFKPIEGEEGMWTCELETHCGIEPGGHWPSADVAAAVVDEVFDGCWRPRIA